MDPPPEFLAPRIEMFERLKKEYDSWVAGTPVYTPRHWAIATCTSLSVAQESKPVKVTLPDGKELEAMSWKTTPYDIAAGISKGLADNTVIAKVGGERRGRGEGGSVVDSCGGSVCECVWMVMY